MKDRSRLLSVGVWIELPPDVELRAEGIARTLAALLRALTERDDTRVVVALANWNETGFRRLLEDWNIPSGRLEVVPSRSRDPLAVRLRRTARAGSTAGIAGPGTGDAAGEPAAARSGAGPAVPGAVRVAARILGRLTRSPRARLRGFVARAYATLRDALLRNEFALLARRANRSARVDVWFVTHPGALWSAALDAPLVVAVPDLVYVQFPTLFDPAWTTIVDRRVRALAPHATRTISYSAAVAQSHVCDYLGVPPRRVRVVPHAPFDATHALGTDPAARRATALRLIREHFRQASGGGRIPDLHGQAEAIPAGETSFLFVTAQVRPTKNYLNLFLAFEALLRQRHRRLKLVMTGRLDLPANEALRRHVLHAGLDLDILSCPNLPSDVHAAFMHLAALTVVPTLFEGGFPFPFSESLSVGTPVVMSDIPVVRETVPESLRPIMLFDPYDVESMTDRIDWALSHRTALLEAERPLHATLCERTWKDVAADYRAIFAEAANEGRAASVNRTPLRS